jgi:predicted nucleic acid-binding Zn ribbon protein
MVLSSRDAGPSKCPKCSAAEVHRVISGTSFQLKGEGWFHSDYGKPKSSTGSSSDSSAGSGGSGD